MEDPHVVLHNKKTRIYIGELIITIYLDVDSHAFGLHSRAFRQWFRRR